MFFSKHVTFNFILKLFQIFVKIKNYNLKCCFRDDKTAYSYQCKKFVQHKTCNRKLSFTAHGDKHKIVRKPHKDAVHCKQ